MSQTGGGVMPTGFTRPPPGMRAYHRGEVDAFLARASEEITSLLEHRISTGLDPAEVREVQFSTPPLGKRGYSEIEVDDFLDLLEDELVRLRHGETAVPNAGGCTGHDGHRARLRAMTEYIAYLERMLDTSGVRFTRRMFPLPKPGGRGATRMRLPQHRAR